MPQAQPMQSQQSMPRSKPQAQPMQEAPQLPNGGKIVSLPRSKPQPQPQPQPQPFVVNENVEMFDANQLPMDGRVVSPIPCGIGSVGSSIRK